MREFWDYLMDMKIECEYLLESSKDISFDDFIKSELLKRAFARSLEIIGEAAKNIPDTRRKYSQIRWRSYHRDQK